MKSGGNKDMSNALVHRDVTLEPFDSILRKFKSSEYIVSVYGLGHVGAPITSAWLRSGISVIGIDKSAKVLENTRKGVTHIPEPMVNETFTRSINNNKLLVYDDPIQASHDSKLKMICVPVLIRKNKADLSAVKEVTLAIGNGLKRNDIVSVHPSVPPGTTEKFLIPLLEKSSGMKAASDFFVIYNPERIYEGRAIFDIEEGHPGIVSSNDIYSLDLAEKLFGLIYKKGIVRILGIKTAEAEKLFEGVYRDVNIALANELAKLSDRLNIDFWEAKKAANSQNFCHIHDPGIGVGGACIPIYPQFILDVATRNKINCRITKTARTINNDMPAYSLNNALKMLPRKGIRQSKITILGLAFRGGVSDTRLSPTYEIVKELTRLKIKDVIVHDPLVKEDNLISKYKNVELVNNLDYAVTNRDLIILATNHQEYLVLNTSIIGQTPIYDGRGYLNPDDFEKNLYRGIGRPF